MYPYADSSSSYLFIIYVLAGEPSFPYKSQPTQLRILKPGLKHFRGSTEFSNQTIVLDAY